MGFRYWLPWWSSKWRWGPVAMPVSPTSAMASPSFTVSPEEAKILEQWAYRVEKPPWWETLIYFP